MVLTTAGQSADVVKVTMTSPTPHSNSSLITPLNTSKCLQIEFLQSEHELMLSSGDIADLEIDSFSY